MVLALGLRRLSTRGYDPSLIMKVSPTVNEVNLGFHDDRAR